MAIAPEFTALSFFHNYQVPPEFDNGLSGSSANEQDTKADGKHPNTYLQKKPPIVFTKDRKKSMYPAGEKIRILIKRLIDIASVDAKTGKVDQMFLEHHAEENGVASTSLMPGQRAPARRIYGLTVELDLKYEIQAADLTHPHPYAECDLEVSFQDGLVEWSLDAQMHKRQTFNDSSSDGFTRDYSELLNRGIMVRFRSLGRVVEYRVLEMFNVIIQGLVLLPFATTLVVFFAQNFVPKRDLFGPVLTEKITYEREMSRFASSCMLTCTMFDKWKKELGDNSEKRLTGADLIKVFTPSMGDYAHAFTRQIMKTRKENNVEGDINGCWIDLKNLVDLLTADNCTLDVLQHHCGVSEQKQSEAAVKINDVEQALQEEQSE